MEKHELDIQMRNAGFISAVHLFASLAIIELSRNAQETIRVQNELAAYAQLTHRHSWGWTHRHFGPGPLRAINTNPQQVSIMSFMHLESSNCAVFRVRGYKHGKRTSADGPRSDRGWGGGKRDSPARGVGLSNVRRVPRHEHAHRGSP